jgi:hypothetical protein
MYRLMNASDEELPAMTSSNSSPVSCSKFAIVGSPAPLRYATSRGAKRQSEGDEKAHHHRTGWCQNEFNTNGLGTVAVSDMERLGIDHPAELDRRIADHETKTEDTPQEHRIPISPDPVRPNLNAGWSRESDGRFDANGWLML